MRTHHEAILSILAVLLALTSSLLPAVEPDFSASARGRKLRFRKRRRTLPARCGRTAASITLQR